MTPADLRPDADADGMHPGLALAFAPVHKRAFGMAVGIVVGFTVFLATAWCIVRGDPPPIVYGLRFLVPMHDVTWAGAVLGSLSSAFAAFVAAWFLAFCRNAVLFSSIWLARTRAELEQTRDFLDHI